MANQCFHVLVENNLSKVPFAVSDETNLIIAVEAKWPGVIIGVTHKLTVYNEMFGEYTDFDGNIINLMKFRITIIVGKCIIHNN